MFIQLNLGQKVKLREFISLRKDFLLEILYKLLIPAGFPQYRLGGHPIKSFISPMTAGSTSDLKDGCHASAGSNIPGPGTIEELRSESRAARGIRSEVNILVGIDRHDFIKTPSEACQKTGGPVQACCLHHLVLETAKGGAKCAAFQNGLASGDERCRTRRMLVPPQRQQWGGKSRSCQCGGQKILWKNKP